MGQASYDAARAFLEANPFYDDGSQSPFFFVQSGLSLRQRPRLIPVSHQVQQLLWLPTVEACEDHYLFAAEPRIIPGCLTVFNVNASTTTQGSRNRFGSGWIVCSHPDTLTDLNLGDLPALFDMPHQARTIGRWRLAGRKVDRSHHWWTSDHLPVGHVWTIARGVDCRDVQNGMAILRGRNEYGIVPEPLDGMVARISAA